MLILKGYPMFVMKLKCLKGGWEILACIERGLNVYYCLCILLPKIIANVSVINLPFVVQISSTPSTFLPFMIKFDTYICHCTLKRTSTKKEAGFEEKKRLGLMPNGNSLSRLILNNSRSSMTTFLVVVVIGGGNFFTIDVKLRRTIP